MVKIAVCEKVFYGKYFSQIYTDVVRRLRRCIRCERLPAERKSLPLISLIGTNFIRIIINLISGNS